MKATRADVLAEAYTWLGTPFHNGADVKGAGVDCAMLLVRVFCDLGLAPMFDPRPYEPQWFMHRDEEKYLGWLNRYARRVEHAQPADVMLFNFGRHAAHGAIVIDDHTIIHAYQHKGRCIVDDPAHLMDRLHSIWSAFPDG